MKVYQEADGICLLCGASTGCFKALISFKLSHFGFSLRQVKMPPTSHDKWNLHMINCKNYKL